MSRNAALLIDLENFYLARDSTSEDSSNEPYDFVLDLERLVGFARGLVGDTRRLIVRRAYSDFNVWRSLDDDPSGRPRREYFLRGVPTILMEQGIEPVQVFRFPGGGRGASKNAADMRLAMDASGLINEVDFFILVTGDKDFIPLVLELRQRGAYVVGLGAHGSIARTLTAYCDEFHEFEALVAADRQQKKADKIALEAVQRPDRDGEADTTGTAAIEPPTPSVVAEPRPHTIPLYRRLLLAPGKLRLHIHDFKVWRTVTEQVFAMATNEDGSPSVVRHHELRSSLIDQLTDDGRENPGKATNDTLFLIFKAGCFVCADPGPREGETDFNWTNHGARFAAGIESAEDLRQHAYGFAVERLAERLRDLDGRSPEVDLVARLLYGNDFNDADRARAERFTSDGLVAATGT